MNFWAAAQLRCTPPLSPVSHPAWLQLIFWSAFIPFLVSTGWAYHKGLGTSLRHVARIAASLCFQRCSYECFAPRDALRGDPGGVAWWLDNACDYPGGRAISRWHTSERILRSQSYTFKNGADNETEEQRKAREAVKRNARRRAMDRFDEEKTEAKNQKRRKSTSNSAAPLAATASSLAVAAPLTPCAAIPNSSPLTATQEQDLKTQRDWAILRGFLHLPDALAVLESIQTAGLDDDEDPFTVHRVRQRHELLCRSFRIVNRLVGGMGGSGIARMSELASLCV